MQPFSAPLSDWGWLIVCGYPLEEEGEKCEIKFTVGREGDDESLGKMETFSAQVFPLVPSLSHSFLLPIRSFLLPRRRLGGISHSEKGVCIMPCSLRRSRKAPPALTRSENPIFTAAKKNERNGKERMEEGGGRKCITVLFRTDRLRQSLLLLPPLSCPFCLFWLVLSLHPARIENPHSKEM